MVLLEVTLGWSKNELRSNIGRVCKELSRFGINRPFDLEVVPRGWTNRKTQMRLGERS
jgi:hypothetical protein